VGTAARKRLIARRRDTFNNVVAMVEYDVALATVQAAANEALVKGEHNITAADLDMIRRGYVEEAVLLRIFPGARVNIAGADVLSKSGAGDDVPVVAVPLFLDELVGGVMRRSKWTGYMAESDLPVLKSWLMTAHPEAVSEFHVRGLHASLYYEFAKSNGYQMAEVETEDGLKALISKAGSGPTPADRDPRGGDGSGPTGAGRGRDGGADGNQETGPEGRQNRSVRVPSGDNADGRTIIAGDVPRSVLRTCSDIRCGFQWGAPLGERDLAASCPKCGAAAGSRVVDVVPPKAQTRPTISSDRGADYDGASDGAVNARLSGGDDASRDAQRRKSHGSDSDDDFLAKSLRALNEATARLREANRCREERRRQASPQVLGY
jgi:hypothetical protein